MTKRALAVLSGVRNSKGCQLLLMIHEPRLPELLRDGDACRRAVERRKPGVEERVSWAFQTGLNPPQSEPKQADGNEAQIRDWGIS